MERGWGIKKSKILKGGHLVNTLWFGALNLRNKSEFNEPICPSPSSNFESEQGKDLLNRTPDHTSGLITYSRVTAVGPYHIYFLLAPHFLHAQRWWFITLAWLIHFWERLGSSQGKVLVTPTTHPIKFLNDEILPSPPKPMPRWLLLEPAFVAKALCALSTSVRVLWHSSTTSIQSSPYFSLAHHGPLGWRQLLAHLNLKQSMKISQGNRIDIARNFPSKQSFNTELGLQKKTAMSHELGDVRPSSTARLSCWLTLLYVPWVLCRLCGVMTAILIVYPMLWHIAAIFDKCMKTKATDLRLTKATDLSSRAGSPEKFFVICCSYMELICAIKCPQWFADFLFRLIELPVQGL